GAGATGATGTTGSSGPYATQSADGAAVSVNGDGTFTYDASAVASLNPPQLPVGDTANDSFVYHENDGHGGTATGTVQVTVTSTATPPIANSFTVATHAVGNTLLEVGTQPSPSSAPKVTDSDNILNHVTQPTFGDAGTITSFQSTTSPGGSVSVDESGPDAGSFTYLT